MIFHENVMGNMGFIKHVALITHLKIKIKNIHLGKNYSLYINIRLLCDSEVLLLLKDSTDLKFCSLLHLENIFATAK